MSGLPNEQPLTRRQARASERSGNPESTQIDIDGIKRASSEQAASGASDISSTRRDAEAVRAGGNPAPMVDDDAAAWAPPASPENFAQQAHSADIENTFDSEHHAESADLSGIPERTLTRRELRALLAAQGAGALSDEELDSVDDEILSSSAESRGMVLPQQPVGHWSLDIDVEDDADDQGYDQLLSRGVGAGGVPTTTNALILPLLPQQPNTGSIPLMSGEMLMTGSISLPNLGATGAHPNRIDSPEVDRLLDQVDDASPSTSASPVRASRAVSTHTSALETLRPPKQNGLNIPTVLAITAAVLALGVIGLFIGGYIFRIF